MRPVRAIGFLPGLFLAALIACAPLHAKEAAPVAADEAVERRMVAISEELRCLVCQNESLAGSHADLAQDLRREIREMIQQGNSDQQILDFMVARYGDFVRYRPPLKQTTWPLWFGPFVMLLAALGGLLIHIKRRASRLPENDDSDAEDERSAAELLDAAQRREPPP